jgi:hypothetical protein
MTILTLALVLVAAQESGVPPSPSPLPTGQIVDPVVTLRDPMQTYALYLPSTYRPDRQWPILYVFDPVARGRLAVESFREPAERFGYIVVGSNNSRNGPTEPVIEAIKAVWNDTRSRLALDPKRVYTTGMSGGTFPAMVLGGEVGAAIVACAGPVEPDRLRPDRTDVDWLGIAGLDDFNYALNRTMVQALVKRGLVARFMTFDGGHQWPPRAVLERAVAWLELSAMRQGTMPPDAGFIDAYQKEGVARARDALAQGHAEAAAEEYAALARELKGLRDVATLESEARRLAATREAEDDRKHEDELDTRYREETKQLFALFRAVRSGSARWPDGASPSPQRELHDRLRDLRHHRESTDPDRAIVARRVLDGFKIAVLSDGQAQRTKGDVAEAKVGFEWCVEAQPENTFCRYELARAYAALHDKKHALAELRRAIEGGFSDKARLTADPDWESFHDDPKYRSLVASLKP